MINITIKCEERVKHQTVSHIDKYVDLSALKYICIAVIRDIQSK